MLVRKDLQSLSQITVQSGHSILEAVRNNIIPTDIEHPHFVICGIKNLEHLKKAREHLDKVGIRYSCFYENDLGEFTSLATQPVYDKERNHFKKFQCLKF